MFFPLGFFVAWILLLSMESWHEPALPQQGANALAVLGMSVSVFLLLYGAIAFAELVAQKTRRTSRGLVRRALDSLRSPWPVLVYVGLLWFGGWDVFVQFHFGQSLLLYALFAVAPYLLYCGLSVLGDFLLLDRLSRGFRQLRAALLALPLLLFLAGWFDLLSAFPYTRALLFELSIARWLLGGLGLVVAMLALPLWLKVLFRLRPVSSELRRDLRELVQAARVRVAGIDELPTRLSMTNALVLGLTPTRRVLFTDLLLRDFPVAETRAVFAHELAHVTRWHTPRLILFFILLPLGAAGAATSGVARLLAWEDADAFLLAFVVILLALVPLFRIVRHRHEHEADYYGSQLVGTVDDMIEPLRSVVRRCPPAAYHSSLFHPSINTRVTFLERARRDPPFLARWLRRGAWMQGVLVLLLMASLAVVAPVVARGVRTDWPGFLIASGCPEAAHEALLAQLDDVPNGDQAAWTRKIGIATRALEVAYGVDGHAPDVATLRSRARRRGKRQLERGNREAVLGWYGLARIWGEDGPTISAVYDLVEAQLDGNTAGADHARDLLRSLEIPPDLRKGVRALLARS